jgi:hypothetical protein
VGNGSFGLVLFDSCLCHVAGLARRPVGSLGKSLPHFQYPSYFVPEELFANREQKTPNLPLNTVVGITTIWPTLLRIVNNRACLYKICLYYNWSKVLRTATIVYLSSVEDRLRPLSFCLVPRELLSWSPITFVHTGRSC